MIEIETHGIDIMNYISTKPETIGIMVLMGSVAVIGLVDFLKCWVPEKRTGIVRWIVFFVSLGVALILSPITPALITTIVILWLLILATATIARNAIVDGIPSIMNKLMGNITANNDKK